MYFGTSGKYSVSAECGKFRREIFTNSLLRILLGKTKNPLFMGFIKSDERICQKYAINPIQNTKFRVVME